MLNLVRRLEAIHRSGRAIPNSDARAQSTATESGRTPTRTTPKHGSAIFAQAQEHVARPVTVATSIRRPRCARAAGGSETEGGPRIAPRHALAHGRGEAAIEHCPRLDLRVH